MDIDKKKCLRCGRQFKPRSESDQYGSTYRRKAAAQTSIPDRPEYRPCTVCGAAVPAAEWFKYAPVVLCREHGEQVPEDAFTRYDTADYEQQRAALNRGRP